MTGPTQSYLPPQRHQWTLTATQFRSSIAVVATCMQCGTIRVAKADQVRRINLEGQCWRS
jgi:hypothetical protein